MVVLDIAIGLVLIYFLYSLLSSIIAEIISSWIGMRARMLKQGIDNILNDKHIGLRQDFKKWLHDIFLIEDNNFKYTNAGKFYEEPTIKYLAKPGEHAWYSLRNRKPAYISPENFVITVLNMFSNKGKGVSEWDKIKFAIETNAVHLEPETLKMFQDMVKRADDSFENFVGLLQNYFADTMERVNGWYKRKIGTIIFYIGFFLCTLFNVDTFQIVNTLSNNKEKRLQMVELADKVIQQKSKVDSLMTKQDSLNFLKYKMEAHGLVKESVLEVNDIMAFGWDFKIEQRKEIIFKSDDPRCRKCKSSNDIVNMERQFNELKQLKLESQCLQYLVDKKFPNNPDFLKSDTIVQLYKLVIPNIDTFTNDTVKLNYLNQKAQNLKGKEIALILEAQRNISNNAKLKHDSIATISGINFILFDSIPKNCDRCWLSGKGFPTADKKVKIVLGKMSPFRLKFWGIILTALALTLGAQFWFDLLKKLVSLRSAGVKPEENEEKKKQLEKLKLSGETITSKDPVEIAISENRRYWESLPGIVAINKSPNSNGIQIIAEDINIIKNEIGNNVSTRDSLHKVKIQIIAGQKAKFLSSKRGYIYLDDPEERGSIAGIFYNKRTQKNCYLTCAHVVQRYEHGHFDYNNSFVKESNKGEIIGSVTNLIRSSFIDAATIDFDQFLLEKLYNIELIREIRDVDDLTIDQRNNMMFKSYEYANPVSGSLEMSAFSCVFQNNRFMYNLMLIKHKQAYSSGGDSGSLIYVEEKSNGKENKIIPVGILVGSATYENENFTLGISLSELCSLFNIQKFNNHQ